MRVSVVGAGYVGLVTGACLADRGHEVACVDLDESKVDAVNNGIAPFHEPGLDEVLSRVSGSSLWATTDLADAVSKSELTLIAVGTPTTERGIDLGAVVAAAGSIGNALAGKEDFHTVVVKSTVVPGTTDGVVRSSLEEASGLRAGKDFGLGVNPEFLTEGRAVADFTNPDRLVLGAIDDRTHSVLVDLYEVFDAGVPRLLTNTRTAEMIKYASNALLATSISFANEIANLSVAVGDVDVVDVMRGVHLSRYLTSRSANGEASRAPIAAYLEAGCGFGGSCLPKDVRALIAEGERLGEPMRVLRAVADTNDAQPAELVRVVERALGDLRDKRVTVLGLAFKPDTDDVRESPAIQVVRLLADRGAVVTVHDPVVDALPRELTGLGPVLRSDLGSALADAEAVVLVTRWQHYRELPALLAGRDPHPIFVDGRRMLPKDEIARYAGIGLG